MTRITAAFFVLGFLLVACQANDEPAITLPEPSAVDALIDTYVDSGAFPFIYVRLEDRDGRVIYEHASVNNELVDGTPIDGQTWIRIWSMSKIVTISVLMDLVEDGVLELDDPVTKFIPEFANLEVAVSKDGEDLSLVQDKATACPLQRRPVTSEMTVLDLITHKAGFYYATTGIPCIDDLIADRGLVQAKSSQELIDLLATLPLIQQPGTREFYGTNTTVLGLVAERATGQSLRELVEKRLTGPLRIDGLRYGLPDDASMLPRYSGQDGGIRIARPGELDIFGPNVPDYDPGHQLYLGGEGMLGTADGYADFLRMMLNRGTLNGERFLDTATIDEITSPHTQLDNPFGHNGYNLWVSSGHAADGHPEPAGLWIGGGYEGTHFWIDPEREFVGVIMTQMFWIPEAGWNRDQEIRRAIYAQLDGQFAPGQVSATR